MSTTQWQWFLTCSITVLKNRPPLKFILPSILVCVVRAERWPFSCVLFIFLHVECRTSLAESFVSEWNVDVFPTLNCMVTLGQRKSTVTNSPPQGVAATALELSHLCHQQPVQQFNSRTVKPASSHFINVGKCSLSSPSLLFTIYLNLLCPCISREIVTPLMFWVCFSPLRKQFNDLEFRYLEPSWIDPSRFNLCFANFCSTK